MVGCAAFFSVAVAVLLVSRPAAARRKRRRVRERGESKAEEFGV